LRTTIDRDTASGRYALDIAIVGTGDR
jgi:hypothetical protein